MNKKLLSIMILSLLMFSGFTFFKKHDKPESKTFSKVSTDNLLAISWQNAFCQTHQRKRECRNVKPSAYSASHFTLHGLWPQPRNKVDCRGSRKVRLEKPLYQELLEVMPAAKSGLQNHEWKKHGTCYGKKADAYFADSIALVKKINDSAVQKLFSKNVGKTLSKKQVMQAFDKSYGKGAGRKVKMMCRKGLITELQINLSGEINPKSPLDKLLKKARNAKGGCKKGKVDAVGFKR
jgi:ribonuclease T2